mmetsp:Transcript_6295/g.23720  ORF Transcript_6295/g.23720 Transcript_6295/m.23720 type:complete len:189 (-) Transcript_6295:165-731(-)
MLISFIENRFPEDYVPTVFENYTKDYKVNEKDYNMELWDTAGQEDLSSIRKLSYPDTSVLIMMYSITSKTSFENVKSKWKVESEENAPGVPIVLVATKVDIREDEEILEKLKEDSEFEGLVTKEDGETLAKEIAAAAFVECSARTQKGLRHVFDECVRVYEKAQGGPDPSTATKKEDKEGGGGCCIVM